MGYLFEVQCDVGAWNKSDYAYRRRHSVRYIYIYLYICVYIHNSRNGHDNNRELILDLATDTRECENLDLTIIAKIIIIIIISIIILKCYKYIVSKCLQYACVCVCVTTKFDLLYISSLQMCSDVCVCNFTVLMYLHIGIHTRA